MNAEAKFVHETTPAAAARVPGERRLSILAVGARQCRWPVADDPTVIGGILCCGATTDATYCSAHRSLAVQLDRPRSGLRGQAPRISTAAAPAGKSIGVALRDAA
jgi:hypothetical protein